MAVLGFFGLVVVKVIASTAAANDQEFDMVAAGIQSPPSDDVPTLTSSSFDFFVKERDLVLVSFCAPGRSECDTLDFELTYIAARAKERRWNTSVAKVNIDASPSLAARFNVVLSPTVAYVKFLSVAEGGIVFEEFGGSLDVSHGGGTDSELLEWITGHEEGPYDWTEATGPSPVITLAQDNFSSYVALHSRVLVKFYSPTCGRSAAFAPAFEASARQLKRERRRTTLAQVDVLADEGALAAAHKVWSYPAMRYFVERKESPAPKAGDTRGIVEWLVRREEALVEKLRDEDVPSWVNGKRFAVVASVRVPSTRFDVFRTVAAEFVEEAPEFGFAATPIAAGQGLYQGGRITLYRRGFIAPDSMTVEFKGNWTRTRIKNWVLGSSFRKIGFYGGDVHKFMPSLRKAGYLKATLIASVPSSGTGDAETLKLRSRVEDCLYGLAEELAAKKIRIAWFDIKPRISSSSREIKDILAFGQDDSEPQLTILAPGDESSQQAADSGGENSDVAGTAAGLTKYVLRGREAIQNQTRVRELLDGFFAGTLKRVKRSQPRRNTKPDEHGMTKLVGDTFEEVVFDATKDVFVMFYAPWCGQSKKLGPAWAGLAKALMQANYSDRGVVIAEMDAAANECVETIPGYPHLVLYPAVGGGVKKKMRARLRYTSAARSVDDLLEFVQENAVNLADDEQGRRRCNYKEHPPKQGRSGRRTTAPASASDL